MKRLIALYPRRWRERYGAELEEFMARRQLGLRMGVDLVRAAIDAHLHPELVPQRWLSAVASGGTAADDLVFVPKTGFRSAHAVGTRANVVVAKEGRTLTAAITPDRDGIRLEFSVIGIPMQLGSRSQRFEDPVRIHDDHGRDISTPRPRWQVGGFLNQSADGTAMLRYTTLLEPLARDVRHVDLELSGAAGEWKVSIPVEPEDFAGAPARVIDAAETKHGITVAARMVARTDTETAIELEAYFDPPEPVEDPRPARRWVRGIGYSGGPMSGYPMRERLILRDDAGREHRELRDSFIDAVARKYREVVTFPALDVISGVLEIPDVWTGETTDQSITVSVPGEADLSIVGCEARAVVSRAGEHADTIRIDVIPRNADASRQLLYLEGLVIPGGDPRGTIGMSITQCIGQQPYVQLPDPTAKVHEVTLRGPVVRVRGPWTLQIPLPRA
jgi:hypothetical protein